MIMSTFLVQHQFFANGAVEYDGEFKNDMRHGEGKLYDENGGLVYDGEWKNDDYK